MPSTLVQAAALLSAPRHHDKLRADAARDAARMAELRPQE